MLLQELNEKYYGPSHPAKKQDNYMQVYESYLGKKKDQALRLLELGIFEGHSMQIWREYMPNATLVGLDMNPRPARFPTDNNSFFVQAEQSDPKALAKTLQLAGGQFDIIIDDASHIGFWTKASFSNLFMSGLKRGGLYVIEDYGAPLMENWYDGHPYDISEKNEDVNTKTFDSYNYGMIGVIKQIMDHLVVAPEFLKQKFPVSHMDIYPHIALVYKE